MSSVGFVKILIKAPNQLVDDQTVNCERNWTIKKLKYHLAKVYPCKPHPDGQKLIYSGQLLSDEAVLSEILRSYDGLENNTIHLVCSMKDSHRMTRQATKPAQQQQPFTPTLENTGSWREDFSSPNTNMRTTAPIIFPPISNQPQNMVQENLFFQQAYVNYIAHFSQMYFMANRLGGTDNVGYHTNPINNEPQEEGNFNRDFPPNERVEDEIDDGQDEPRINRDWLEWFYIYSRLFILFTVVYFYSSPERFIMVVAMALILINIDVFRWRRGHNLVETQQRDNDRDASTPNNDVVVQPSWFNITWTFMKTFFLSLVPDNRDL